MSTLVIACQTIYDELNYAIDLTNVNFPILWIDSRLHDYPEKLRLQLQKEINKIENFSKILLAFGFCGNTLLGIRAGSVELIFPKVSDCISLLLGSGEQYKCVKRNIDTYYVTKGWLESENGLLKEYNYCLNKFGKGQTTKILKLMLKNYNNIAMIDTGAYDLIEYKKQTEVFAKTLGLDHTIINGSLRLFKKLLVGPWDEEFVIIRPGQEITLKHLLNP